MQTVLNRLTKIEQRFFHLLLDTQVATPDEIMVKVWDFPSGARLKNMGRIAVTVSRMREKLSNLPMRIETIRGTGYRLLVG